MGGIFGNTHASLLWHLPVLLQSACAHVYHDNHQEQISDPTMQILSKETNSPSKVNYLLLICYDTTNLLL